MLLAAAARALEQMLSPPFRSVLWKSLGLTVALLVGAWFAAEALVSAFLLPFLGPWPWLSTAVAWIFGAGLVVGAGLLIAPVASVFAGLFLDDVADVVQEPDAIDELHGEEPVTCLFQ